MADPEPLVKMPRQNDPALHHVDRSFWEYVEKMDGGRMRCKFCGHQSAKDSSISRIKHHLAGVKRRGVRICGKVPRDVQDAALAAIPIDGPPEKKLKNAISASAQEQNMFPAEYEWANDLIGGGIELGRYTPETSPITEHAKPETELARDRCSPEELLHDEFQTLPRTEPKNLSCLSLGSYYDQLCSPSVKNDVIMDDVQSVVKEKTEPSRDDGRIQVGLQSLEQGAEEELICLHPEAESGMENTCAEYIQHVDRNDSPEPLVKMFRQNDPVLHHVDRFFWEYVEKMDDGRMRCKFCGHQFAKATSISRIIIHLAGVKGRGTKNCGKVPQDVQHAALEAFNDPPEKKLKTVIGSSNAKPDNLSVDAERIQVKEEEDVLKNSGRLVQHDEGGSFSGGIKHNPGENRGALLFTGSTKLVGRAFEENRNVIWSWLMDDEVSTIGIYGMGGAGKTTMLKHIYNELQQTPDISLHVYWVTVSRDFNIHKLQNKIAKHIQLSFSSEEEELGHKTAELSQELMKKQRWILILDDLWNSFNPHEVGIPGPLKGSKLIMTTRSEMVCQQMNCQNSIRVDPLSDEEAWTLFMEKLGHERQLSQEEKRIAVDAARECAGLPLGIVTLAESLKGVHELHKWKITLKRLKESIFWEMEDQIFQILRLSYDCLDYSTKQCFVYCALFDESQKIERRELIESFIKEGIIKDFDKGHSILDSLENVCLLERIDDGKAVKMHDLLRDMGIQILADEYSLNMRAEEERG